MDSARSWLQKLQPRDKDRDRGGKPAASSPTGGSARMAGAGAGEEALSSATKQKVAAAKQYIENHYKAQMKSLQERKERSVRSVRCPFPPRSRAPRLGDCNACPWVIRGVSVRSYQISARGFVLDFAGTVELLDFFFGGLPS